MDRRDFGTTGLTVTPIGLGASHIGAHQVTEDDAGRFLNAALDLGINLVDTARGYGLSEERIGRHLAHRRGDFVLSTKIGYGIEGTADWTPDCIRRGIDEALRLMRTDHLDIVHFHSCEEWRLEHAGIIDALLEAKAAGKIRVAAYSGENEPRDWAIHSGRFGSIQTSVNLCDQQVINRALPACIERGLGVIAKRPIANAFWRFSDRPAGDYAEEYWHRAKQMGLHPHGLAWDELALRFTIHTPGVHSCIVGTSKLENLRRNVQLAQLGPLPAEIVADLRGRFAPHQQEWSGQV